MHKKNKNGIENGSSHRDREGVETATIEEPGKAGPWSQKYTAGEQEKEMEGHGVEKAWRKESESSYRHRGMEVDRSHSRS